MVARIQVDLHAPLPHGAVDLRSPRASRLAVTRRSDSENPLDVVVPWLLAPIEFRHAFIPTQVGQIHGRAGLNAVPVRVIADLVLLEGIDDILPAAPLQSARLFPHDFEGGPDVFLCQKLGHSQGSIIASRQDVILRVEPQNDVDLRRLFHALNRSAESDEN